MVLSEGTKETLVAITVTALLLLVLSISFLFAKKRARKFKKRTTMATLSSASFSLFLLAVFLLIAITYSNADDIEVEFRSGTPSFKQKKSHRKRYFQEGDYSDTYSSSSNNYTDVGTGDTADTGNTGTHTGTHTDTGTSLDSIASVDFRRGVENGIYMQEMRIQRIEDKIKSMFNKEESSLPSVSEDINNVLKQELSDFSSSINLTDTNPEHYMRTW